MLKTISKTFGVVAGTGFGVACVAGLITGVIFSGDPNAGSTILGVGTVIGYQIGVIVGIVIVNKYLHYQGSPLFGIIGVIMGGVIPYFMFDYVVIGTHLLNDIASWILVFTATPLLGTLGYRLFKKRAVADSRFGSGGAG